MALVIKQIHSRWYHYFPDFQLSAHEFYTLVETQLKSKEVSSIRIKRVNFGGLFSKREYLRIQDGENIFDVCAAPYGKGYFISWWMGESVGYIKSLLIRIPLIGPAFDTYYSYKTYYQWDTITMFQECARTSILEAIDGISTKKGIRMLSELERQVRDDKSFK